MKKTLTAPFTLIELLVVVAIISILASMLLPALSHARASARRTLCLANQKQMMILISSYADDNEGTLPYQSAMGEYVNWSTRLVRAGYMPELQTTNWNKQLDLGKSGRDIRLCPELMDQNPTWFRDGNGGERVTHYAVARSIFGDQNSDGTWNSIEVGPDYKNGSRKIDEFSRTSQVMGLTEVFVSTSNNILRVMLPLGNPYRWRAGTDFSGGGSFYTQGSWRHNTNSVNFAFLDGHGENRTWTGSWGPIFDAD